MAFGGACAPPGRPGLAQAAVALLRALVGGKEGHWHAMALEHLGHQVGNAHVARVERQVHGLGAARALPCGHRGAQQAEGGGASQRLRKESAVHQRCAWASVQTPWGDLPTLTCWTTFFSTVSITDSLRAQRELTSR